MGRKSGGRLKGKWKRENVIGYLWGVTYSMQHSVYFYLGLANVGQYLGSTYLGSTYTYQAVIPLCLALRLDCRLGLEKRLAPR